MTASANRNVTPGPGTPGLIAKHAPTSRWFACFKPNPRAVIRLFCFPYAGGSALIFSKWADFFPANIEVCPIQLPGRGNRTHETPFSGIYPLVESIATGLLPYFDKPFAFFGHSMGAIISFELARLLRREGHNQPLSLFVSGRSAPQTIDDDPPKYNLPGPELLAELRRLNGTPREVLEHPELMEVILPLLRADFAVAETYDFYEEPPLDCPISVYGGLQDKDVPREDLEGWRVHTTASFTLRMVAGDHFFLNTARTPLLQALAREMYELAKAAS